MKDNMPVTKRREHNKWMTGKILDFMGSRRKVISDPEKYNSIYKLVKENCNETKEEWMNQQCHKIDEKG